jgi:hypothetical protein
LRAKAKKSTIILTLNNEEDALAISAHLNRSNWVQTKVKKSKECKGLFEVVPTTKNLQKVQVENLRTQAIEYNNSNFGN